MNTHTITLRDSLLPTKKYKIADSKRKMGRGPIIVSIVVECMHHWRYVILEYEGNPRFTDNAGKISIKYIDYFNRKYYSLLDFM